jgi:hypothetical protein
MCPLKGVLGDFKPEEEVEAKQNADGGKPAP